MLRCVNIFSTRNQSSRMDTAPRSIFSWAKRRAVVGPVVCEPVIHCFITPKMRPSSFHPFSACIIMRSNVCQQKSSSWRLVKYKKKYLKKKHKDNHKSTKRNDKKTKHACLFITNFFCLFLNYLRNILYNLSSRSNVIRSIQGSANWTRSRIFFLYFLARARL